MKINIRSFPFKLRYISLIVLILISVQFALGQQQVYRFHSGLIEVSGFTNSYNWKMKTDSVDCRSQLSIINGQLKSINSLSLTVPVNKLSSPNTYMDRIAHRTLKSYPFDKIYFHYVKSELLPWDDKDQYLVKASGNLTIAGITQAIKMDLIATVINDGIITFAGTHKLKLSTFQVTPKKTLMGTLKTSDEVTVNFVVGVKPFILPAVPKK
ncbi:YceI family protein [Daejeonella sp.]|uniref:YceI family protein n=1 Tax=Daejeonella sp. TaxID=2805397 RepID=UPI0027BAA096|nr:YceI family protein [Daejeonella sp.]